MTLDNDILHDEHSDLCIVEEDQSTPFTSTAIPIHQTPGSQLLCLQKQLRDELAKCSAAVFMVDDIAILENVKRKVHTIHSELLSTSSICDKTEELPILKNLMKEEVSARVSEKSKSHSTSKSADSSIQEPEAKGQHRMSNTIQTAKTKG